MVLLDGPETPEEAAALRELLGLATTLSRESLLQLLRRSGGDVDVATAQLFAVTYGDEDHFSRYGSSEYQIEVADEEEFGGQWGGSPPVSREPTASDDQGLCCAHSDVNLDTDERPAAEVMAAERAEHSAVDLGSAYHRMSVCVGGLINDNATGMTSFLNEGIVYIDVPMLGGAVGNDGGIVVDLDLAVLDPSRFQEVLDSWLMDGLDCVDAGFEAEGMGGGEDSFDYGAAGEVAPSARMLRDGPVLRSDPAEFRAYLDALLNEDPATRAARIEQERLDEYLAQQLYAEELHAYEDQFQRTGTAGPHVAPAAGKPTPDRPGYKMTDAEYAAYVRTTGAPAAKRVGTVAVRPPPAPSAKYTPPSRISVTTTARGGNYVPRTVQIVLPPSVRVVGIQNITNRALERRFAEAALRLRQLGYDTRVDIAYHGTDAGASASIAQGGFIAPLGDQGRTLMRRSGNPGYFGNGIYLSPSPTFAQNYAAGGRLLVCNVLRGKSYRCSGMMMGAPLQTGYSSHVSPCGSEWIFFNAAQVLPVAVIHFGTASVANPAVLPALESDAVHDRTALALAAPAKESRVAPSVLQQHESSVAALTKLTGKRLSNRDRKLVNRAMKGQQQR
jgi:hypothetical protein